MRIQNKKINEALNKALETIELTCPNCLEETAAIKEKLGLPTLPRIQFVEINKVGNYVYKLKGQEYYWGLDPEYADEMILSIKDAVKRETQENSPFADIRKKIKLRSSKSPQMQKLEETINEIAQKDNAQ